MRQKDKKTKKQIETNYKKTGIERDKQTRYKKKKLKETKRQKYKKDTEQKESLIL